MQDNSSIYDNKSVLSNVNRSKTSSKGNLKDLHVDSMSLDVSNIEENTYNNVKEGR